MKFLLNATLHTLLNLIIKEDNMKNRSSSSVSSNSSGNGIYGSTSSTMSNNINAAPTIRATVGGSTYLSPDDVNDSNPVEMHGLLNSTTGSGIVNSTSNRASKFRPISALFLSSLLLFYVGWYGPRRLMNQYTDAIIERNKPPYQIISTDSTKRIVILDPTYNHPVIEPPKISSSFLIFTSVTLPLFVLCVWPFATLYISVSLWRWISRGTTTIPAQKGSTSVVLDDWVFALYESAVIISGLLSAIGITEGLTQCLKMYIGRLRPNMYQLCQFSTVTLQYSTSITKERIREGHLSFPSGHSSLASVSMVYCTWYFLHFYNHWSNTGTLQRRQQSGSDAIYQYSNNDLWTLLLSELRTLIIVLFLPGWAVYVGMTRIVDHWHHVSDVLAGLLLGSMIGTITFHTIVPPALQYLKVSLYNTHRIYDIRTDERHNCMSPGLSLQIFNQPATTPASPGSTSSAVPV